MPFIVPYSDLLDMLSLMCMVKYATAYVILFSVTKLTLKLPNNLTVTSKNLKINKYLREYLTKLQSVP
jgi:hypothetical protein